MTPRVSSGHRSCPGCGSETIWCASVSSLKNSNCAGGPAYGPDRIPSAPMITRVCRNGGTGPRAAGAHALKAMFAQTALPITAATVVTDIVRRTLIAANAYCKTARGCGGDGANGFTRSNGGTETHGVAVRVVGAQRAPRAAFGGPNRMAMTSRNFVLFVSFVVLSI